MAKRASASSAPPQNVENASIRADKWLWFARVVKSRSLAQKLIKDGFVRLNGNRLEAAHRLVRPQDVLTIGKKERVLVYKIVALGERRGPASEAQSLFEDLSPPAPPRKPKEPDRFSAPKPEGRPSRDDRRALNRLKQSK